MSGKSVLGSAHRALRPLHHHCPAPALITGLCDHPAHTRFESSMSALLIQFTMTRDPSFRSDLLISWLIDYLKHLGISHECMIS